MKYNINRRKFLELFTGSCCGLALPSCTKVPITERRQLTVYPESTINKQASAAYAKFKSSSKLIDHIASGFLSNKSENIPLSEPMKYWP